MAIDIGIREQVHDVPKRYVSLDFARGIAIMLMIFVHVIYTCLDIDSMMNDTNIFNAQPLAALTVPVFISFIGGLAGFFLLISAASNMVSMYRDLEKGKPVKSLVFKQIIGGFLLLIFAYLSEGVIGYFGVVGDFFLNLNNPAATNWQLMLWRWNVFETIHAIAACIIINGCVQGLLSMRGKWKNKRQLILIYFFLAIIVVSLTDTVWEAVGNIVPGYPFGTLPNSGHGLEYPVIGTDTFWEIFRAPFLSVFASSIEPLFPYLAVSFIGSIIGIILSKPKEEISKHFPRRMLRIGGAMYGVGIIGIGLSILSVFMNNFDGTNIGPPIFIVINFYMHIMFHRTWTQDNPAFIGVTQFAWFAQFLAVTGLSIMLLIVLFRLVEFRGSSHKFAKKTKIVRRFGTVAFSNYNNQWLYFIVWEIVALIITREHYKKLMWGGTALIIIFSFALYILILWLWEKINYLGSMEWTIRSITNNLIPLRRERINATASSRAPDQSEIEDIKIKSEKESWIKFRKWLHIGKLRLQGKAIDHKLKWWQKGQIDVDRYFYNVNWTDIVEKKELGTSTEDSQIELKDSQVSLVMSLVGLFSIFLFPCAIFGLVFALKSFKNEGKNTKNIWGLLISILAIVIIIAVIVILFVIKTSVLGL